MLTLLLACSGEPSSPLEPAPEPPRGDEVLILVDTLRADALHFAGNPRPTSPELDRFVAEEAAWFSRAYACSSWTLSSTATLLTGLYPWEHRVVRGEQFVYGRLAPEIPTLGSAWQGRGLRSAAFVNNMFVAPEFGFAEHFETYDYVAGGEVEIRSAEDTVSAALAFLEASEQPAGLVVHFMDPHWEYVHGAAFEGRFSEELPHEIELPAQYEGLVALRKEAPSEADQAFLRARYDEEVAATDAAIGRLLEGLRARPGWSQSTVVVSSDHGEEFWDHGGFEHGHSNRSAVTRVPLIVKAPGVEPHRNDTVLDHVSLSQALMAGEGDFLELARSGQSRSGGVAISQDVLYGPQEISAVSDGHRLVMRPGGQDVRLWEIDAQGIEGEELSADPQARAAGEALFRELVKRRGGLERTEPADPRRIDEQDEIARLRALGYLE